MYGLGNSFTNYGQYDAIQEKINEKIPSDAKAIICKNLEGQEVQCFLGKPEEKEFWTYIIYNEFGQTLGGIRLDNEEDYINVTNVCNFRDHKFNKISGVGTALIQKAVEVSFEKGKGGKLQLYAVNSSHVFHWKMGFKVLPKMNLDRALINESLNKEIEKAVLNPGIQKNFPSAYMYLPTDAIKKWECIIDKAHGLPS